MMASQLILSCEHASDRIPARYQRAFVSQDAKRALASHRGIDFGATSIARSIVKETGAPCIYGRVSRLLVDLNRTQSNPRRFSEFSSVFTPDFKAELDEIHGAHWRAVRSLIDDSAGSVVHVAVHTFSPILNGRRRAMDIGILYDPHREKELRWARRVQTQLQEQTGLRVRRNAPYRGIADGLPTGLRRCLSARKYLGIELEINQALVWPQASEQLAITIAKAIRRGGG